MLVSHRLRNVEQQTHQTGVEVSRLAQNVNLLRQRRRHLLAKQRQHADTLHILEALKVDTDAVRTKLRESQNNQHIEKTQMIIGIETPMRKAAEESVMRASRDTYWTNVDEDMRSLRAHILRLEGLLGS
jgi:predicted DNA-binding helix-hairpin-helix protein